MANDPDVSPIAVRGDTAGAQHGSDTGHLGARNEHFEVISKLELTGRFGNVLPEQLADVAVHNGFAYLNSWNEPTCERGGTYIVDIRDPAAPKEIGFVAAPAGSIHGEGAHVVTYKGRSILAVNNEPCTFAAEGEEGPGGFDLIDVTNPYQAVKLGPAGQPTGGDTDGAPAAGAPADPTPFDLTGTDVPHSNHSTVMWEFSGRLFLMTVDNVEGHDIDIFDISTPETPAPVAEYDLDESAANATAHGHGSFPEIVDSGNIGSFAGTFHHDSKVKIINGRAIALTAYWDGGYVTYDVSDPNAPKYIGDSSFLGPEPLSEQLNPQPPEDRRPLTPPEGNAHYAEFSHDNRFILAADEDFTTHRAGSFAIEGVDFPAAGVGGGATAASLPDRTMNGPTVYGGYACDASLDTDPIPTRASIDLDLESGEEAILVVQRGPTEDTDNPEGACFPGEKAKNAYVAGWRNVLFINRHTGSAATDAPFCGSGDFRSGQIPVSVCTTHAAGHELFDDPAEHGLPYDDTEEMAALGTIGDKIVATSQFDSWGYAHLYRNMAGKFERIDSYAVAEALDERYATGFGDLSIHEHAADDTENLSYIAYYAAGMRAISFNENTGITEVGSFIDEGGSNFWGVEQYTAKEEWTTNPKYQEQRIIAGADRDHGLYLFRYTGPGAAVPPVCTDSTVMVPFKGSVTVPLACSDANGNPITRSLLSTPVSGTVSAVNQGAGTVTYTHTGNRLGVVESLTIRAADPAARSNRATVTLMAVPRAGTRCLNPLAGTAGANNITGSPFGDSIRGGRGTDLIQGRAQDDCLFGEGGNDLVFGQLGKDTVDGGSGNDRLWGDSNADTLRGKSGADTLHGGSGGDRVEGGSGNDEIEGADHPDRLIGGDGNDAVVGGSGNDRLEGGDGRDVLTGGPGVNRYSGGGGNDNVRAVNEKRDTIACGRGVDDVEADARDRVARDCERVSRARTTRR